MGEELDDYMSDDFLNVTKDVKPGLVRSREHKIWLKAEAEKMKYKSDERLPPKKKHELERSIREEALSKPVPETSKGFALMAKMGFKPGMSLGKKKDENDLGSGIREPIPIEVKATRTGLGHGSAEEQQAKLRLQREMERMKRRAEQHVELTEEYKKRKREISNTKDLIRDILASRKICVELDLRINMELPEEPWFWKSYCKRKEVVDDDVEASSYGRSDCDEDLEFLYANGKEAPQEERYDELPDEILQERLVRITGYLRDTHRYCIWCGCQFENFEELGSYCPGQDRQAHDSIDELCPKIKLGLCASVMFVFFGPNEVDNESILNGKVEFEVPTYILGPCTSSTSTFYPEESVEFSSSVTYLGKRGILNTASGLQVAYLSGVEGPSSNSYQFNEEDVEELLIPVRTQAGFLGVDVLVTSMWPAEVKGSRLISRLASGLKPRNHRVLLEPAQHVTRFIGLAPFLNNKKQKWLYAFNIQPMRKMTREELTMQPPNSSEFPYMGILEEFMAKEELKKKKSYDVVDRYRFDMSEEVEDKVDRGGRKRRQNDFPSGEKVPAAPCWFCLSNVDVEKHLVVSVGDQCYAAMPKGPLVEDHVMVLTIGNWFLLLLLFSNVCWQE
ncbi:g-patch domain protein [Cooperia oncophora]